MDSPLLRISAKSSDLLTQVVKGLAGAPKEIQKQVRQRTKDEVSPDWQSTVAEMVSANGAAYGAAQVLASTATVSVSNQNVMLKSASKGKYGLDSRGNPLLNSSRDNVLPQMFEFGAPFEGTSTYEAKSRKGKYYVVHKRHTRRRWRGIKENGYAVYPAASKMIPRFASLWVQTVMRTIGDALDGKADD